MPNIAIEIATNAKWYHIVTLKMRVSRISYVSVASAIEEQADVGEARRRGRIGGQSGPDSSTASRIRGSPRVDGVR